MKSMVLVFIKEADGLLKQKRSIYFILILLWSMVISVIAINNYNINIPKYDEFKSLNAKKVEKFTNYTHYTLVGVRVLTKPHLFGGIFLTKGTPFDLTAIVDTVVTMDIFLNAKSKSYFQLDQFSPMRFPFLLLLIGSLFSMIYGKELQTEKHYLSLIKSTTNKGTILFHFVFARILLLFFITVLFLLCFILILYANSVSFSSNDIHCLMGIFFVCFLCLVFCFSVGLTVGMISKNDKSGYSLLFSIWVILLFIIPGFINSYIEQKAENIPSSYKADIEQSAVVDRFEESVKRELGSFDRKRVGEFKEKALSYLDHEYKDIEKIENKLKNEIFNVIDLDAKISVLFPTSFFKLTSNEVSGYGHLNFKKFYSHTQKVKKGFMLFYIDKCFNESPPGKPVQYEVEGGNLFKLESNLPEYYWAGVWFSIAWCTIGFLLSYFLYKYRFHKVAKRKVTGCDEVIADFKPGLPYNLFCMDRDFPGILMNVFWGHPGAFNGKLALDGENIVTSKKKDFLYFPNPTKLSVTEKAGDFMTLMLKLASIKKSAIEEAKSEFTSEVLNTPFNELATVDKVSICLTIALSIPSPVYIFENFAVDINRDEDGLRIIRQSKPLVNRDSVVIDMYTVNKSSWLSKGQLFMTNYDEKTGKYSFSKHG